MRVLSELQRLGGPGTAVAARNGVGFTSLEAFRADVEQGAGTCVLVVPGALENRVIRAGEELQWVLFPEGAGPVPQLWDATAAAIDIEFTDGTRLSELEATDQYGAGIGADAQAAAKAMWVDQWNRRAVGLDAAIGKQVARVLAVIKGSERTDIRVFFDDIDIHEAAPAPATALDAVVTTRGTQSSDRFSRGNNAPLVAVPHGGVFGLPMTNAARGNWPYSYHADNRATDNKPTIQAFATSHIPSPWMGDRGVFQIMPSPRAVPEVSREARALGFTHGAERPGPHRYGVDLEGGLSAELTAGAFALGIRFTFPGDTASIIVDHHGTVTEMRTRADGEDLVLEAHLDDRENTPPHYLHVRIPRAAGNHLRLVEGRLRGYVGATPDAQGRVDVLLGISTVDYAQAAANLTAAGGFETMLESCRAQWESKLSTLEVAGASADQLTSLYSGLYRLFLYPNRAGEPGSDGTKRYRSPYGEVLTEPVREEPGAEIMDGELSTTNGFWDTYRTAWPLLGLLTPAEAGELAQGFVQHFHDGGWTPRWSAPSAEDCMTGTTSDTVFADLLVKNVPGLKLEEAYASAVKNATVPAANQKVGRKGIHPGIFRGYIDTATGEGMSWTLDNAINDWALAQMAALLAAKAPAGSAAAARYGAEHEYFARRSLSYREVFDTERGFFIGRNPDGAWRVEAGFDPTEWGHDYTETNAWGTAFTVPHDGAGLAELHGGEAGLGQALDTFFDTPETGDKSKSGSYGFAIHEMTEARDVRMGMLGLSNQPAHHIPFMYMFAGRHDDAHRIVREAISRLFVGSDIGQGYPGDEDNGEMSGWYIFATLGLYPLAPASGSYVLIPPSIERAVLRPTGGEAITIEVTNPQAHGSYIESMRINGQEWNEISVPHSLLASGAHLEFTLCAEPSGWAAETRPASASALHGFSSLLLDATAGARVVSGVPGAGTLIDDTGATPVVLGAGDSVHIDFVAGAAVDLYTLTAAVPGSLGWSIDLFGVEGKPLATERRTAEEFSWAGQTRVFRLATDLGQSFDQVTGLRFTAGDAMTLRQLEVFATEA
ncbi:alpha-1,2-mannosidase [Arthrobacter sp. 7749]|nr:alpha-1,2-mannosidase [Arthrobacter sp. 7749]